MKSSLFFAPTPNFQSLCTVLVKLGKDHKQSETLKVQPQVIRCREIIFTDDRVIASPSLQENTHIYVILQQSYWKTGQFQALCKKLGLEFMKPVRVITAVFQSCFSYTLKAKLAPLWNKVGELYINGRDFLTNPGPLPAVNVDINVTGAEICLALKGFGIYFSLPSLESWHVSDAVLQQFGVKEMQTIPEFAIQDKWCHVLPSTKKGRVISLTQTIPQTSPFKRYKEMRRYWKNAYGYRLPEDDSDIYYVNIHFPVIGTSVFTYPSLCVRRGQPTVIPRINPDTILATFVGDVLSKMPTACEHPLEFCKEAMYTKKVMAEASLKVHLLSSNNLSSSQSQFSQRVPMRNLDTIPRRQPTYQTPMMSQTTVTPASSSNPSSVRSQTSMRRTISQNVSASHLQTAITTGGMVTPEAGLGYHQTPSTTRGPVSRNVTISNLQTPNSTIRALPNNTSISYLQKPITTGATVSQHASFSNLRTPRTTGGTLPQHGSSTSYLQTPITIGGTVSQNAAISHIGTPITTLSTTVSQDASSGHVGNPISQWYSSQKTTRIPFSFQENNPVLGQVANQTHKLVPMFQSRPVHRHLSSQPAQAASAMQEAKRMVPRIIPTFKPQSVKKPAQNNKTKPARPLSKGIQPTEERHGQLNNSHVVSLSVATLPANQMPSTTGGTVIPVTRVPTMPGNFTAIPRPQTAQLLTANLGYPVPSMTSRPILPKPTGPSHVKRKAQADGTPVKAKKPKKAQTPKQNVDIELLAVCDQLNEVNAVTLTTWLKSKGHPVKSKEKKADLIKKVMDYITAQKAET